MTEHDALFTAARNGDKTAMGALADHLEERGRPNAHLIRAYAERGGAHLPQQAYGEPPTQHTTDSAQDGEGAYWSGSHGLSNYIFVQHPAERATVYPAFPGKRRMALAVPVKHKADARHLISDLPDEVKQMFEKQLIPHLPDGPAEEKPTRSNTHLLPSGRDIKPHIAMQLARTGLRRLSERQKTARLLRTPSESYTDATSKPDIESLEAAVRADPQDAQSWSLLAIAYQALGRDGDAAEARALAGILAKLARPKPGEQIAARHLTGEAFRQREIEPSDTYHTPIRSYKIDPQIAGTAFAYHLRKIAQSGKANTAALAEYALAGRTPPGVNGDVYRALGNRLRAEKHPLANAYDWSNKSRSLSVDNWLERFIRKNVQSHGKDDRSYFDAVRRQFGNGAGKNKGYHAFWSRLQKAADADAYVLDNKHREDFQQTIEDALHRISDRHFDRAYLARTGDAGYFDTHPPTGALRLHRAV